MQGVTETETHTGSNWRPTKSAASGKIIKVSKVYKYI